MDVLTDLLESFFFKPTKKSISTTKFYRRLIFRGLFYVFLILIGYFLVFLIKTPQLYLVLLGLLIIFSSIYFLSYITFMEYKKIKKP